MAMDLVRIVPCLLGKRGTATALVRHVQELQLDGLSGVGSAALGQVTRVGGAPAAPLL